MDQQQPTQLHNQRHRRGIYLLPNLFTTAALFAGFYAILASMDGQFGKACLAIFVAMVLDGLDGRIARLTHTQTAFGAEYDSLSDMVAFGLAPALVVYQWALTGLGKFGWLAAFIYTAGAALRLARFNSQLASTDKRYFRGLPSPSAAALIAGAVWISVDNQVAADDVKIAMGVLTGIVGLLMVSNLRYHSFKQIDMRGRVPFFAVVLVMLLFAVVLSEPPLVLFLLFLAYGLSGPALWLRRRIRRNREDVSKAA
jgi:CDP-diacylglycerol--serine O-phosphatidyltransferase